MTTLHSYILRELLKAFGLALVAMVALLTLCGGIYNFIKFEGITGADLAGALPYFMLALLPWLMPVAALFACALVYGRLASDNEMTACRAAGINVYRLYAMAVLLGVFVWLFAQLFLGALAPGMQLQVENVMRRNLRDLAAMQFRTKGYARREGDQTDKILVTAERVSIPKDEELRSAGHEPAGNGISYLQVDVPTFLQRNHENELVNFWSAEVGLCKFDVRSEQPYITAYVRNLRQIEMGKHAVHVQEQQIGPFPVPWPFTPKLESADLRTLFDWLEAPWKADRLSQKMKIARLQVLQLQLGEFVREAIARRAPISLRDEIRGRICTIHAERAEIGEQTRLETVRVDVHRDDQTLVASYEAPTAQFRATPTAEGRTLTIELRLESTPKASMYEIDVRDGTRREITGRSSQSIDGLNVPPDVWESAEQITPARIVDVAHPLPVPLNFDDRMSLAGDAAWTVRKIWAVIHIRLAYPASSVPVILLGAILGTLFRGSRVIAAFGVACIPAGFLLLIFMAGKSLTSEAATHAAGPVVIWSGLFGLLLADLLLLRYGVRR